MKRKETLKFAAIQMSMDVGNIEHNLRKAEKLIDEAVRRHHPDVIGLPEFFNTEYFPSNLDEKFFSYAEPLTGRSIKRIAEKARAHNVHIFAPIFEEVEPAVHYDSSALISPKGKVEGVYRKVTSGIFNWKAGGDVSYETYYFRLGTEFPIFQVGDVKIGQLICYDRHFPEHWRILALKGAQVIFIPTASSGKPSKDGWNSYFNIETRALAFINQCYAIALNRVGVEDGVNFYGGSHIVDPEGRIIAGPASATKEEIIFAELDIALVRKTRHTTPFYRDRRPELYQDLSMSQPLKQSPSA